MLASGLACRTWADLFLHRVAVKQASYLQTCLRKATNPKYAWYLQQCWEPHSWQCLFLAGLWESWVGWSLIYSEKPILRAAICITGCCEHPPVSPELEQGLLKASVERRAQMDIGNTGKVKCFSSFSFSPLPFDRNVAKGFLMSQALFSDAVSPPHLYCVFMLLSSPSPPEKLCSCLLLPLSWLGTGGDGSLEWDTSSLSLSV